MANIIRQRRRFPVASLPQFICGYRGIIKAEHPAWRASPPGPTADFALITSTWMNSDQVGCCCDSITLTPDAVGHLLPCIQCREDGRTSALKATGRWTHVRRVIGRRHNFGPPSFSGCIRYDWYGFHDGYDATTQTYEGDMVRPVQHSSIGWDA